MPYEDEHRRGFNSRVVHEVCYHGDPRTEVVLHRILRGQKRLSAGAADVTGERTILLLAAYSSHSSSFRKSLLLIAVK
jgi:hypothetical protein